MSTGWRDDRQNASPTPRRKLARSHILIVEDEFSIAEELCARLEEAAAIVVGPASTVEQARQLAQERKLDGAVLDIELQGELIYPVADLLVSRGVPFVFAAGGDEQVIPERFAAIPRRHKPVNLRSVTEMLA